MKASSLILRRFPLLLSMVFLSTRASADPASLEELQARLMQGNYVNASGELIYQMPAGNGHERQYEKFSLKFDRQTKRLRLSYERFQGFETKISVEAWGTLDCLQLLRMDYVTSEIYTAKTQPCQKLQGLYSMLSEGTPTKSAPVYLLQGEVEGSLLSLKSRLPRREFTLTAEPKELLVQMTEGLPASQFVLRYWISPKENAIAHCEIVEGSTTRTRINYSHVSSPPQVSDFSFTPTPEQQALAEFALDRKAGEAKIKELADHGSKSAKYGLISSDGSMQAAMMGYPMTNIWSNFEALQTMGLASAFTMEGQLLGRMRETLLPDQFRAWPLEKRQQYATELVIEGAKRCDRQALIELTQGRDFMRPTAAAFARFDVIKADCNSRLAPPEARLAMNHFSDPWPR